MDDEEEVQALVVDNGSGMYGLSTYTTPSTLLHVRYLYLRVPHGYTNERYFLASICHDTYTHGVV